MAAWDAFTAFVTELPPREKEALGDLVHNQKGDLLAARSEDARVRLVEEFIRDAKDLLSGTRK
jgi:hypothetical protein